MDKKQLISKIKSTTSLVEFYKLKGDILQQLEGVSDKGKKDKEADK